MYTEVTKWRICGNANLISLVHLGDHTLTGVFPKNISDKITLRPLELAKSHPKNNTDNVCHLVQIHHSYDSSELNVQKNRKFFFGYGASTKGNVILQYCGLTIHDISFIAEVNEDKFGSFTPFTHIPIISEKEAKAMKPDYFLVLPWHFRKGIIKKENDFLKSGGKCIFPLPKIEIIH